MKILVITGPPYSGKGTQCEILSQELQFKHISTGDRCRQEKANKTEIGEIMASYEEKGELVPDALMKDLFTLIVKENKEEKGIILDGYPRTNPQVDDLMALIQEQQQKIDKVLYIDVPHEELLERAKKRAADSTRKDDRDSGIHLKRIDVFEKYTRPAIEYMQTKLNVVTLDGLGEIAEVTQKIEESLMI